MIFHEFWISDILLQESIYFGFQFVNLHIRAIIFIEEFFGFVMSILGEIFAFIRIDLRNLKENEVNMRLYF